MNGINITMLKPGNNLVSTIAENQTRLPTIIKLHTNGFGGREQ
jgi:hypothetical protein